MRWLIPVEDKDPARPVTFDDLFASLPETMQSSLKRDRLLYAEVQRNPQSLYKYADPDVLRRWKEQRAAPDENTPTTRLRDREIRSFFSLTWLFRDVKPRQPKDSQGGDTA